MNGFFDVLASMRVSDANANEAMLRAQVRQQQWQRGFSETNPFTKEPAVRSAVAAEAYQGTVIEGSARRTDVV